jgi:hypothetical protein
MGRSPLKSDDFDNSSVDTRTRKSNQSIQLKFQKLATLPIKNQLWQLKGFIFLPSIEYTA